MNGKGSLLIVDDSPEILRVLSAMLLKKDYAVLSASSGAKALELARALPHPDLILLDVQMPGMDGYEVLKELSTTAETSEIPVIFLTGLGGQEDEERGLALGAVDYITKPIRRQILLSRVKTQLDLKRARDWLHDQNEFLESEILYRMRENSLIQDVTLRALANIAETRDPETGNHIRRTQAYMELLARKWSEHPQGAKEVSAKDVMTFTKAAPLHDIGKVGIPDHVLLKPGRLTPEEYDVMKLHSDYGASAIEKALLGAADELSGLLPGQGDKLQKGLIVLQAAKQIARYHHERWDGKGYPDGLAGETIPIAARLMALADVFDALISRRVYKPPFPLDEVVEIIQQGSGTQFQPELVEIFMANLKSIHEIAVRFNDDDLPEG
jgi:putative two-component system response regulator